MGERSGEVMGEDGGRGGGGAGRDVQNFKQDTEDELGAYAAREVAWSESPSIHPE